MSAEFYTQATNFTNFLNGGVDPRTGLFTLSIPVATLTGARLLGPQLELALTYSPLNGNVDGLGNGISNGMTCYDQYNHVLSLAAGGVYNVYEFDGGLSIKQEKLHTLTLKKVGEQYHILHKNGNIEILGGPFGNEKYYPVEMISAQGHRLYLSWTHFQQGARLQNITSGDDARRTLLQVAYHDMDSVSFMTWPGTAEEATLTLNYNLGYLRKVTRSGDKNTPPLIWTLDYTSLNDQDWLTSVMSPTGLLSEVTYQPDEIKFPEASGISAMPAVSQYSQRGGTLDAPLISTYIYTDTNYLGYKAVSLWQPDEDNLYNVPDYIYGSTETQQGPDNNDQIIERRYNNFHLQISEKISSLGCTLLNMTTYYIKPGAGFDDQPPQFQLPKQQQTTYTRNGKSRTEVTLSEFDTDGNPTRQVTSDGTETQYTYYLPQGEDGCPPEPNGFVRFLKEQREKPVASTYQDEPERFTQYRYARLGDSDVIMNAVTLQYSRDLGKDTLVAETHLTYVTDSQSSEFGRLNKTVNTLYNLDGSGQKVELQQEETYEINGDVLHKTVKMTGYDSLTTDTSETRSIFNGLLLAEQDVLGNRKTYAYDALGRLLESVVYPKTEYESRTTYAYTLSPNATLVGGMWLMATVTDTQGNSQRTAFDALGREIYQEVYNNDAAGGSEAIRWYEVERQRYDALGRVVYREATDYLTETAATAGEAVLSQVTETLSYDGWGNVSRVRYNDGHSSLTEQFPEQTPPTTESTVENGQARLGRIKTTFNLRGQPTTAIRYDAQGQEQGYTSSLYDGLGRVREETDELNRTTGYTYDGLDRVVVQTLPDGSEVRKDYAPQSADRLITNLSIVPVSGEAKLLGEQRFDSRGRTLESISGGRSVLFQYDTASGNPSGILTPTRESLKYRYIPELGNALLGVSAGDGEDGIEQTFIRNKLTGELVSATVDKGPAITLTHTPSGKLQKEVFDNRVATHTYSLLGAVLSYTDVTGAETHYRYDELGRVVALEDPSLTATLAYDAFGRVNEQRVEDKQAKTTLTTVLTYDDFSREVARDMTGSQGDTVRIVQTYRVNNQTETRTTLHNELAVRTEAYEYDIRNRLVNYICEGSQLPVDAYGKALLGQLFEYDALNNITRCTTTFDSNNRVISAPQEQAE